MIPIPAYLRNNAVNSKQTRTNIQFDFVCNCGNEEFFIFQNHLTEEEQVIVAEYEKALSKAFKGSWTYTMETDEEGVMHYWRLYTPLEMYGPKKEVFPPEKPPFADVNVIKVQCAHCGKEYVLFDSRHHGYDAVTVDNSDISAYVPFFKQKNRSPVRVVIKVINDSSLEEFIENTGEDCNEDFYSNAFGAISIYTVNCDGKKRKIFDAETA